MSITTETAGKARGVEQERRESVLQKEGAIDEGLSVLCSQLTKVRGVEKQVTGMVSVGDGGDKTILLRTQSDHKSMVLRLESRLLCQSTIPLEN